MYIKGKPDITELLELMRKIQLATEGHHPAAKLSALGGLLGAAIIEISPDHLAALKNVGVATDVIVQQVDASFKK